MLQETNARKNRKFPKREKNIIDVEWHKKKLEVKNQLTWDEKWEDQVGDHGGEIWELSWRSGDWDTEVDGGGRRVGGQPPVPVCEGRCLRERKIKLLHETFFKNALKFLGTWQKWQKQCCTDVSWKDLDFVLSFLQILQTFLFSAQKF